MLVNRLDKEASSSQCHFDCMSWVFAFLTLSSALTLYFLLLLYFDPP